MPGEDQRRDRVFKTTRFSKASKKARIPDDQLCSALAQVILGQADDLGGGVFKKRLGKNLYRSIILAKGRQFWIYEYLFAKKDRSNIDEDELAGFRMIAVQYGSLNSKQVDKLVRDNEWMEICHES